jgi:hypothetical protein
VLVEDLSVGHLLEQRLEVVVLLLVHDQDVRALVALDLEQWVRPARER